MSPHPLRTMLDDAARGLFPPADGDIDLLPAPDGRADIVLGFTAHLVIAAPLGPAEIAERLAPGDFSMWMAPAFLAWLGERLGSRPATFDALLCAPGTGTGAADWLHERDDLDHPRVERASRYRTGMRSFATDDDAGMIVVGRGVCGRWEIGYEVAPDARGRGVGRRLVAAARGLVPAGEPVWAQVAPGNAASMRSTLAGGFWPVAAEVLFPRSGGARI
jgi:GNAT superfamily N-acetyltransferase